MLILSDQYILVEKLFTLQLLGDF